MGKYETLAKEIVKNIGGKENVISLTHCITRLRFKLKDEKKANDDVLKNMEGIVTVMKVVVNTKWSLETMYQKYMQMLCHCLDWKKEKQRIPKKRKVEIH